MQNEHPSARQLAGKELREVLASTEALLAALGDQGGDEIEELRRRLTATIEDVREQLSGSFLAGARERLQQARDTAVTVNEFVNARPWTSVVIATGLGVLLGMVLKGD